MAHRKRFTGRNLLVTGYEVAVNLVILFVNSGENRRFWTEVHYGKSNK